MTQQPSLQKKPQTIAWQAGESLHMTYERAAYQYGSISVSAIDSQAQREALKVLSTIDLSGTGKCNPLPAEAVKLPEFDQ